MKTKERITKHSAEEIEDLARRGEDKTDWEAFQAITQDELEALIANDPDEAGWEWGPAHTGLPAGIVVPKKQLTVRIDQDVIDWYKAHGKGYQTRMNAVLRRYMEHHEKREAS